MIRFSDPFSNEMLQNDLLHPRYQEFASHNSPIMRARGAVAVRVGDRTFLGDVRIPDPSDPYDSSKDDKVRHQILYSSYSGAYPAMDSFPPANAFSVGEGSSRTVAMFEHAGRLVVLTTGAALVTMVQPGDYASVQYERVFAGLGGVSPSAVARTPLGVAWLSQSGVYYLSGPEPRLISAPINDAEFLGMIKTYGANADLFYGPRRKTLFLCFPGIKPAAYAMSESGAWTKIILSGYDDPVDFKSGFASASGEPVALMTRDGETSLAGTKLPEDLSKDFDKHDVTGVAQFPTAQPAGGDRVARFSAVNCEHSESTPGTFYAIIDGVASISGNYDQQSDRTRVDLRSRGRNVSVYTGLRGPGNYVERASIEFIPKGRSRR